ncbi:MAG: metalloprotease [Nanoarchaeota archaeon]|nr:metalloprotease [Nanoarchaeota archaeon]
MRFSRIEIKELFIAWLLTSIAFAILFSGGMELFKSLDKFFILLLFSSFTAGIGFVLHEIMHKYLAQKYNLWAEFRAFYPMLFLAIIFSLGGFIIAAPGAVFIRGSISKEKNGKISLAGPMMNIILAFISLAFLFLLKPVGLLELFFKVNLSINSLLSLFNLLPFGSFDGKDVYEWNKAVYFICLIIAIILFAASYII